MSLIEPGLVMICRLGSKQNPGCLRVYQDLRSFLDRCYCHTALFNGTPECHRTNTALRLGRSAAAAALCSVDYPVCQGPGTT